MEMNEPQRREFVQTVVGRVLARLNEESHSPASGQSGAIEAGAIEPCAVPPPGSERYEAVLHAGGASELADRDLAPYLDHTLLKPEAGRAAIEQLCGEALRFGFASVCVHPCHVELCADMLQGSEVKVCTVVGFPLGAMTTESKAFETGDAARRGAGEIDMVINIGWLKDRDYRAVRDDIAAVVHAAEGRTVKVIIEAALLEDEEKVAACAIVRAAGAHFVKTSTGFAASGAKEEDVRLMREAAGPDLGLKAAGGIRDAAAVRRMIAAGATRIGASASVAIVGG